MGYNKIGFNNGDTLTADHLNHMERGISGIKTFTLYSRLDVNDSLVVDSVSFYEEAYAVINNKENIIFFMHGDFIGVSLICSSFFSAIENQNIVVGFINPLASETAIQLISISPLGVVTIIEP